MLMWLSSTINTLIGGTAVSMTVMLGVIVGVGSAGFGFAFRGFVGRGDWTRGEVATATSGAGGVGIGGGWGMIV